MQMMFMQMDLYTPKIMMNYFQEQLKLVIPSIGVNILFVRVNHVDILKARN